MGILNNEEPNIHNTSFDQITTDPKYGSLVQDAIREYGIVSDRLTQQESELFDTEPPADSQWDEYVKDPNKKTPVIYEPYRSSVIDTDTDTDTDTDESDPVGQREIAIENLMFFVESNQDLIGKPHVELRAAIGMIEIHRIHADEAQLKLLMGIKREAESLLKTTTDTDCLPHMIDWGRYKITVMKDFSERKQPLTEQDISELNAAENTLMWARIYISSLEESQGQLLEISRWIAEESDRILGRDEDLPMHKTIVFNSLARARNDTEESFWWGTPKELLIIDGEAIGAREQRLCQKIEAFKYDITKLDIGRFLNDVFLEYYPSSPLKCTHIKADIYSCRFVQFHKTHWRPVANGIDLLDAIITRVVPLLSALAIQDKFDKREKKRFISAIAMVKNSRRDILVAYAETIFDSSFEQRVNQKTMLLPFDDVVLDLATKQTIPGHPDHLFTYSTGYDFPKDVTTEQVSDIESFITKIFPENDVREYMLRNLAYCLSGLTRTESFHILVGTGSNGKTVLDTLNKATLGQFYQDMIPSRLCQEFDSAKTADPELLLYNGARLITVNEPSAGRPIVCATLKRLTSESISCRQLYSNQTVSFKFQGKLFINSNVLPQLDSSDFATKRRAAVCMMLSEFVSTQDRVDEANHVYLKDMSIKERMDELRDAYLHLLIRHFDADLRDGVLPKAMQDATSSYIGENDTTASFFRDNLVVSKNPKSFVRLDDLYRYYLNHMRCSHKEKPPIAKTLFPKYLVKHFSENGEQNPITERHTYTKTNDDGSKTRAFSRNVLVGFYCQKLDTTQEHNNVDPQNQLQWQSM